MNPSPRPSRTDPQELSERTGIDDKHIGKIERGEKEVGGHTLGILQINLGLNSADYLNEFIEMKTQQKEKK